MTAQMSRVLAVVAAVGIGAMTARGAAQGSQRQSEDVLPALLDEVRGLRVAMEQLASAGPRVQLALGRLQLQEQRINTMLQRAEAVRDSLASARAVLTDQQTQVTGLETELKTTSLPADVRENIESHLIGLRRKVLAQTAEVQRLSAEEASLGSDIGGEQARWADINQRLEELERALTRR